MSFLRLLRSITDNALDKILIILMSIISLLVFVQVLLRYIFHAPLMGIEELLLFPTSWLFMLGAVRASSEKTQIVARVLEIFSKSPRFISGIRVIASVMSTIVLLWLFRWGYDYFKYLMRVHKESPVLYIPTIFYEIMVFIALALMIIFTLVELYEHICHFKAGTAEALRMEGDE